MWTCASGAGVVAQHPLTVLAASTFIGGGGSLNLTQADVVSRRLVLKIYLLARCGAIVLSGVLTRGLDLEEHAEHEE